MLTASEAAKRLGVSVATLYAYVSRGLIRSHPDPSDPRSRLYAEEDIDRRVPGKGALHGAGPVLDSAITLIDGARLYYRGLDATELAQTRSVEEVASLVWTGTMTPDAFALTTLHVIAGRSSEGLPFVNRGASILPIVAARDPLAYDLRPHAVAQTGWRILNLLTSVAAESSELADTVDETLQQRWAPNSANARDLIRAALILCADHELNVSSFTARCIASAGSNPYAVVAGGLAAIEGSKHGGMTARVETMLDELARARDVRAAMSERMRRGEAIAGFGHRLYPNGDPRAEVLLEMIGKRVPKLIADVASAGEELLREKPTIDFALVALARTLKLPADAPITLFALGRTIGWVGQAIEQYARDEIIRPRARYTGPPPTTSSAFS
jgi:citrate synthase